MPATFQRSIRNQRTPDNLPCRAEEKNGSASIFLFVIRPSQEGSKFSDPNVCALITESRTTDIFFPLRILRCSMRGVYFTCSDESHSSHMHTAEGCTRHINTPRRWMHDAGCAEERPFFPDLHSFDSFVLLLLRLGGGSRSGRGVRM